MRRRLGAALAVILLAAPAAADPIDEVVEPYLGEIDWQPQDPAALLVSLALEDDDAGTLGPLQKALLLVEANEPPLPRTRTLLRYGQVTVENAGPLPISLVQVERYNLGPTIREQVIADYGAENTGAPEDFGVGPHVAWRFAFAPAMEDDAFLLGAARLEIADTDAEIADCLGRGCLDLLVQAEELQAWTEAEAPPEWESPYEAMSDGVATAPRAAAELTLHMGLANLIADSYEWNRLEQPSTASDGAPFLFVLIDRDLGQDTASDAILALTALDDESLAEIWSRRLEFPGSVSWFGAPVPR